MRIAALFALLVALAAAGWAGQQLWQELQAQEPPALQREAAAGDPAEPQPPRQQTQQARRWPYLFGEPQPPKPPGSAKKEDEPQPPPKKFPPLASMGYVLKGTVTANGTIWALVSHASGEHVLRVGDALREDLVVTRIDGQGLWATPKGGDEMLLEWPE